MAASAPVPLLFSPKNFFIPFVACCTTFFPQRFITSPAPEQNLPLSAPYLQRLLTQRSPLSPAAWGFAAAPALQIMPPLVAVPAGAAGSRSASYSFLRVRQLPHKDFVAVVVVRIAASAALSLIQGTD